MNSVTFAVPLALAFAVVTLAFLWAFRRERARLGTLAYFSPALGFYLVFLVCFLVRPVVLSLGGLVGYDEDATEFETFLYVLGLAVLGAIAFYLAFDPPFPSPIRLRLIPRLPWHGAAGERDALLRTGRWLVFASVLLTAVFFTLIVQLGAVTLDLGVNRAIFSAGTSGRGDMFLVNTAAAVCLLSGLYLTSYRRSPLRPPSMLSVAWFLVPNVIVTNRFLITAVILAYAIVWMLHRRSIGATVSARGIWTFLACVALLGSALGLVRGFGEYEFDEANSANILIFFIWTFDMAELLARTIERTTQFDFGWIWIEDILYLYVPRALWPGKPQIFGAIAAQQVVLPELIPADGIPIATYPVGVFGEGYFVLGAAGVFIALWLTGNILRRVTSSMGSLRDREPLIGALLFPVFALQCLNPLGYYRSFGWFVSLIVFHFLLSAVMLLICSLPELGRRSHLARPLAT